jgi:hypothetical protein
MEKMIKKINAVLPKGAVFHDCRKKPLTGTIFGVRNTSSRWMIETPRKQYWFRSVSAIYRFCDTFFKTDFHAHSPIVNRDDDYVVHTRPKRFVYQAKGEDMNFLIPTKTWGYRKKMSKGIEEQLWGLEIVHIYNLDGTLTLFNLSDAKKFAAISGWKVEKVTQQQFEEIRKGEYYDCKF